MRDIEAIEPESGRNSRALVGEQSGGWADESVGSTPGGRAAAVVASGGAKSGGDLYKYLAKIESLGVVPEAVNYNLNALDGFDDESNYLRPAINVGGTMLIIVTLEGTAIWFALVTDTLAPTETTITNVGGVTTATVSLTATSAVAVGVTGAPQGIKLTFTPTSAALNDGLPNGGLEIRGVDSDNNPIIETITWLDDELTSAKTTENYFATGDLTARPSGFSAGSLAVTVANAGGTVVRFEPRSGVVKRFITMEGSKGETPHRFYGLCISTVTISLDRTTKLMFDATFMGRRALMFSAFGDDGPNQPNPTRTALPASLVESNDDAFVGWMGTAYYGGIKLPIRSFNININRNLVFTDGMGGEPYQVSPPVGDGKREVPLTLELIADNQNNWDRFFETASDFTNLVIECTANSPGQYGQKFRFVARRAQIITSPSPVVTGPGPVYQTAEFRCVRPRRGNLAAYYIEATYQDYERVQRFT